jgi:predicted nuclease of predicted toxin-antitoxin system
MTFLANENFHLASIHFLRNRGYDVESVLEKSPGATDNDVLEWARREGRILLTFDSDYGRLIYESKLPPPIGVVYFRFNTSIPEEPAEILLQRISAEHLSLQGQFTVLRRNEVRQRPMSI